jgi:hypothetical protein
MKKIILSIYLFSSTFLLSMESYDQEQVQPVIEIADSDDDMIDSSDTELIVNPDEDFFEELESDKPSFKRKRESLDRGSCKKKRTYTCVCNYKANNEQLWHEHIEKEHNNNAIVTDMCNSFTQLMSNPVTAERVIAFKKLFNSMLNLDVEAIQLLYLKLDGSFVKAVQNGNAQAVKFLLALSNIAAPHDQAFLEFNQLLGYWVSKPNSVKFKNQTVKATVKGKHKKIVKLMFEFLTFRSMHDMCDALLTELLNAADNNDIELIKYLIPVASLRSYNVPLMYKMATRNQNVEMRKMISQALTKKSKHTRDTYYAEKPSLKKLCALAILNNGVEIRNANIPQELTEYVIKMERKDVNCLVKAYTKHNHELCEYLIAHGADVNARSKYGLSYAQTMERNKKI